MNEVLKILIVGDKESLSLRSQGQLAAIILAHPDAEFTFVSDAEFKGGRPAELIAYDECTSMHINQFIEERSPFEPARKGKGERKRGKRDPRSYWGHR